MKNEQRWEEIVKQINQNGYMSVQALSDLCDASIITIRRDLDQLDRMKRLKRTHGGAASLLPQNGREAAVAFAPSSPKNGKAMILERFDALISSDPLSGLLPAGMKTSAIPIIAESMDIPEAITSVEVDNYTAGFELGKWAGNYAQGRWNGRAVILDLTYHRPNTQERSQGFVEGVRAVLPQAELRCSVNSQSRLDMAYQLTRDALSIHPDINIIFAINDTSALGAYRACKELGVPIDQLIILTFGIEGPTMLNLIERQEWCVAGLAMFPQIVAAVCVEAAVHAYQGQKLPARLTTPFCILTRSNLSQYYRKSDQGWNFNWPDLPCAKQMPLPFNFNRPDSKRRLPGSVGFLYTYIDHEWYKQIVQTMKEYCTRLGIHLEVMDFAKTQKDELALRRKEIAQRAAHEIQPGDTIFIDGGVMARFLAGQLGGIPNLTVITNSLDVVEELRDLPYVTLLTTGGALRRSSQVFVGPTAEATLKEFHIDKLFLMVRGVSATVGLSHTHISEVTIKQQMIRSAREVILLADHDCFTQEALVHVAPISVVHKIITDDALPASIRLDLGTQGIQVILASM